MLSIRGYTVSSVCRSFVSDLLLPLLITGALFWSWTLLASYSAGVSDAQAVTAVSLSRPATPQITSLSHDDLSELGYTLDQLQDSDITVRAHDGAIPRRCAAGTSAATHADGMAIIRDATYRLCADGVSPLYDEYRSDYACTIVYNTSSPRSSEILAHELGHCFTFTRTSASFTSDFRDIRNLSRMPYAELNEIVAEDFRICQHGFSDDWGQIGYYQRYDVAMPTVDECGKLRQFFAKSFAL